MQNRGYQPLYSDNCGSVFDQSNRQKKAQTMLEVLKENLGNNISFLSVLNVGGSAGIIDEYLSKYFGRVISIDIDEKAVNYAKENFRKENLTFAIGDAMDLQFDEQSFDVVICSHVYEHVPDAQKMMVEIYRVLKSNGIVFFAAGNRIMINEPHYNLPFLSVLPRPIAHLYLKMSGKADFYYEKHLTYWGLKKLVQNFVIDDYTPKVIANPERYRASYMVQDGSAKHAIANFIAKHIIWLVPSYIWVLRKIK